jgi:hypothetical protein
MKETWRGATPDVGVADAVQVSVQGAVTVTVPVLMQVTPLTVAVMVQEKVPGLE